MLLYVFGCNKENVTPINPSTDSIHLEVVWHKLFHSDSTTEYFLNPLFFNNYMVLSSCPPENKSLGIKVYHKKTGTNHPAWDHEPGGIIDEVGGLKDYKIGGSNNDILFIEGSSYCFYAVNLNTGQRLWKYTSPYSFVVRFSMLGDNPCICYKPDALSDSWARIAVLDALTGTKTDLLELYASDNYKFKIEPPVWAVNSSNDTLLLFLTSGWNFGLVDGRVGAYCYNLTKKQMLWSDTAFTRDGDATDYPPILIDNNLVIFQSLRSIHCFDISTGDIVWQHEHLNMSFSCSPFLYYDGKIFIRSQDGIVLCYDAQTGKELWINSTVNAYPAPDGRMDAYNGKLYIAAYPTSDIVVLICMSTLTGEVLWKDEGPAGVISGGLLIDQETGYLYCHSDWSVMCIDLNKTPKETKNKK